MGEVEQQVVDYLTKELDYGKILRIDESEDIDKVFGKYEVTAFWHMSHFGSAWESKPVVAVQITADDRPYGFVGVGDIETEDEFHREMAKLADAFIKKTNTNECISINEARKSWELSSDSDLYSLCVDCLDDIRTIGFNTNIPLDWKLFTSHRTFGFHTLQI